MSEWKETLNSSESPSLSAHISLHFTLFRKLPTSSPYSHISSSTTIPFRSRSTLLATHICDQLLTAITSTFANPVDYYAKMQVNRDGPGTTRLTECQVNQNGSASGSRPQTARTSASALGGDLEPGDRSVHNSSAVTPAKCSVIVHSFYATQTFDDAHFPCQNLLVLAELHHNLSVSPTSDIFAVFLSPYRQFKTISLITQHIRPK